MTDTARPLLAYEVQDDYEGHVCIVFETNSAAARRNGAAELNTEWKNIDRCRRVQEFDQFAPGPVPPRELLAHGWWFECVGCGRKVTECDSQAELDEDEGLAPLAPCFDGAAVYCEPACRAEEWAKRRQNKAARAALIEWVFARFPDAERVHHVHVYGVRCEKQERPGAGLLSSVTFSLPGLQGPVSYHFGEGLFVCREDEAAYTTRYLNGGTQ
jgi:hypothetical protein